MPYQNIARLIPTIQAAKLAEHNVEKIKKKDMKTKDMLELGVTNIVGVGLIKTTADLVEL